MDFLKNLKDALDFGDFNSDAAKKIGEINKMADEININLSNDEISDKLNKFGVKNIDENDIKMNEIFDETIKDIKKDDLFNKIIANLLNINKSIENIINNELIPYLKNIENEYNEEIKNNQNLNSLIIKIKEKYKIK